MYVYTPVRNNAGRATTLALARYPFSGQPSPSRPALPRRCHHPHRLIPHQPLPLPIRSTIDHPHRPSLPPTTHPLPLPPSLIALNSVSTASLLLPSATHTTTHSFHPSRTPSFSPFPYLSLSLSVSTSVFLKRPIQSTRRVRPYGAVSTGTPARSLKENAIIRRTSTNELIVGASRYRQYREVLYSTSPGATRL